MNSKRYKAILWSSLLGFIFSVQMNAQYAVKNSVFGSGGTATSDTTNRLVGTVGQPVIGVTQDASHINQVGFWYQVGSLVTSVEHTPNVLPIEFRIDQNYPNPFNPTTTIRFSIPKPSSVTLKLFDMLGREVATLVDEDLQSGECKVIFDATGLTSGVYFYRIQAGEFTQLKKLMLLK